MKKILTVILITAMLLTVQVIPVFADNTADSYILTEEDEKRLMNYTQNQEGGYYVSNDGMKTNKYLTGYLTSAEQFMEARENYDYKKIVTEAGKAEYEKAFMEHMRKNFAGSETQFNRQVKTILDNNLVKESTFASDENCIYKDGGGHTIVRGVEYFTIISKAQNALEGINTGVEYKRDVEVVLSRQTTKDGDVIQ
jgi:hypothetical protein